MSKISSITEPVDNEVKDIIESIKELNPESLIVFALKDKQIHIKSCRVNDTMKVIGALEAAKMQLWNQDV